MSGSRGVAEEGPGHADEPGKRIRENGMSVIGGADKADSSGEPIRRSTADWIK